MRTLEGLLLDRAARVTLQEQLATQIRSLIQQGTVEPGESLPSTRDLATELNVSRNTAVYAYDRLISEGYLTTSDRSGVFVSPSISLSGRFKPPGALPALTVPPAPEPSVDIASPSPFRPCQPDVTLFPLLVWNRLRGRVLRSQGSSLLHYQASCISGLPALRENVAKYLRDSRGVRCDSRQVVITAGSQQALFILASLLLNRGDRVYMEDPGYVEARVAWQNRGARIVPGRIDSLGLVPPDGRAAKGISLVYTTPSRQFPTGVSLTLPRRLALLDFVARAGAWMVEDDYDSELRYGGPPLPSLQSLDQSGRVIYVGTFSKLLFPSLRLGYVVVPDPLVDRFVEQKHLIDDHLPLIDQATLSMFLESGCFYSHIRRCRRLYAERQSLFMDLFAKSDLPFAFEHTDGGMNITGFLPPGTDDAACSARLREAGFDVPALSHFAITPTRPGLVFGFTAFSPDVIRSSFERLERLVRRILGAARGSTRMARP